MTYRILAAAALLVAVAAPALADTTTTSSSTSCWRGTCTTETKTTLPDPPPKPNTGYLPNFSGTGAGGSTARSETVYFRGRAEAAPADPKCQRLNACLVIHPGNEGAHGFVSVR